MGKTKITLNTFSTLIYNVIFYKRDLEHPEGE